MRRLSRYLVLLALTLSPVVKGQDYQLRMAFIGNSISAGFWLPEGKSFPDQLAVMLQGIYGDTCYLHNYALSGRTMFKQGDSPFWREPELQEALDFAPNLVFIMLGTNDSKAWNWGVLGYDTFVDDYLSMVDTFLNRNPHTTFILGYPPPAFDPDPANVGGISDSIIHYGVIPAVDSVIKVRGGYVMDFYTGMTPYGNLFFDKIHPYTEGATVMAEQLRDRMIELDIVHTVETGLTFITSFEQSSTVIGNGESFQLYWDIINYDSIMLNDQRVYGESISLSPEVSTDYCLRGIGPKSSDSVLFSVEVYNQEFTRIGLTPKVKIITHQDTVWLKALPLDQRDRAIRTRSFPASWTIESGDGEIIESNDTSAVYVPGPGSQTILRVEMEGVGATANIIITGSVTAVDNESENENFNVYPNPFTNSFALPVPFRDTREISVQLYRADGRLVYEDVYSLGSGEKELRISGLDRLQSGIYLLSVSSGEKIINLLLYKE